MYSGEDEQVRSASSCAPVSCTAFVLLGIYLRRSRIKTIDIAKKASAGSKRASVNQTGRLIQLPYLLNELQAGAAQSTKATTAEPIPKTPRRSLPQRSLSLFSIDSGLFDEAFFTRLPSKMMHLNLRFCHSISSLFAGLRSFTPLPRHD